jgi:hypothetical protein
MTDVRLPASGNIKVRWHADNAFANPARPTPTEVNAGLKLENVISWQDYDFGIKASNTNSDPALSAKSNVSDRGAIQYNGGMSFYLPADYTDMSNENAVVHAALKEPRTNGWITVQIDGELSETNTPTYAGGLTQQAANGDLIHVFKVMTAGYANAITGEEAFRETVTFLPQGEAYINAVVSTTTPTVVVTPATATPAPGDVVQLAATVNGRAFTRGVRWSSSDTDVATVSQNGVVTIVGDDTDTATITATYLGATADATLTVTA